MIPKWGYIDTEILITFIRDINMTVRFMYKVFLFSIVFFLSGCGSGRLAVHYTFEQGKSYQYSTIVDTKVVGQAMGQEFNITSGTTLNYSLTILEQKDHLMKLTATITRFAMQINFPMMGLNDSTIVMSEYNGKRIQIVMTEKGKTLSVESQDTIPPSRVLAMLKLSPNDLFKQLFLELPDHELEVNGTWKKTNPDTTVRGGMKTVMKQNIECKVSGREEINHYSCWKILINGSSQMEGSGSQGGNDVSIDGTIKVHGMVWIAPEKGIFVSSEQSVDNDVTTTVTGSQTGASTMLVKTTIQSKLVQ
jgi:hypothetical protein